MGCKVFAWIISVCGIAFLAILCDVIVPDGSTKKYVRSVIGVVVSLTMLLPVANLALDKPVINFSGETSIAPQQQYLQSLETQQQLARVQNVDSILKGLCIENYAVDLSENESYVTVGITCNKDTLLLVQKALSVIGDNIVLIWRDSSEQD